MGVGYKVFVYVLITGFYPRSVVMVSHVPPWLRSWRKVEQAVMETINIMCSFRESGAPSDIFRWGCVRTPVGTIPSSS
jgi:hypothetical protein